MAQIIDQLQDLVFNPPLYGLKGEAAYYTKAFLEWILPLMKITPPMIPDPGPIIFKHAREMASR